MKKTNKYYRELGLGVFPYGVLVCQGMPMSEVRKYIEKKYDLKTPDHPAWAEERMGKTLHLDSNQTILWLKNPPTTPDGIACLTHEAVHTVFQIYNTMGVPFNADNDEVVAYAVEHIVSEVLKDF